MRKWRLNCDVISTLVKHGFYFSARREIARLSLHRLVTWVIRRILWPWVYFQWGHGELSQKVIQWRHEIHQNPELSNREFKTADKVANHLRSLGIEVQTGVAHTGVIGLLKGKRPGKVLALRADMDGLPVKEDNDLPYKSNVVGEFGGQKTGVMHACGHDTHVSILMGVSWEVNFCSGFMTTFCTALFTVQVPTPSNTLWFWMGIAMCTQRRKSRSLLNS